MPWRDKVNAIVQAWYPGQAGAQAIAEVLAGKVNPSGRTPITWPASLTDTPRPMLSGLGTPWGTPVTIRYDEGAEVGYRWYAKKDIKPLYAFGHGLSYTSFAYSDLTLSGGTVETAAGSGQPAVTSASADAPVATTEAKASLLSSDETVTATFTVTNTGDREGADVPQLYLIAAPNEKRMRLLGFERVVLQPGESKRVTLTVDPRLLARFDGKANQWRIIGGKYQIALGKSAGDLVLTGSADLEDSLFGK